jgi:NAD(P)H-hydrate epimerase
MRAIVDSATMRLLEDRAFEQGHSAESLMDAVGKQLSKHILSIISTFSTKPTVLLLAGKGNNGADGYTALLELLDKNVSLCAWQVAPTSPSSLVDRRKKAFQKEGGKVFEYPNIPSITGPFLIIDGIYGSGFKGAPDQETAKAILWANAQRGYVISIDIPSGVDPTTGEVPGEAIFADYTLACHFPKKGCFLGKGWEYAGKILLADLPLQDPKSDLSLIEAIDVQDLLPRCRRTQNKFRAGTVVSLAGSRGMMGAASLSCESAYTVGAGYVRLLLDSLIQEIGDLPREVVKTFISGKDTSSWSSWFSKADSLLIGPGLGRDNVIQERLAALWSVFTAPSVIDADALFFLSQRPQKSWDVANKILTPHLGEASRLIQKQLHVVDEGVLQDLRTLTYSSGGVIVLKGSPTFIFSSGHPVLVMPRGDPGMATAGTGDVLSGVIAGLLAQKLPLLSAAMLGTWLHGLAGEESAKERTSYSVMASSVLRMIPKAIFTLLHQSGERMYSYVPFGRVE